eukprot:scaffold156_cov308-Prasinococcus_capsulatus_cf.AAC.21
MRSSSGRRAWHDVAWCGMASAGACRYLCDLQGVGHEHAERGRERGGEEVLPLRQRAVRGAERGRRGRHSYRLSPCELWVLEQVTSAASTAAPVRGPPSHNSSCQASGGCRWMDCRHRRAHILLTSPAGPRADRGRARARGPSGAAGSPRSKLVCARPAPRCAQAK